jgi:formylglycine-generating enzyme required for sulfatase activity
VTTLKAFRLRTYKNLQILRGHQAKLAGRPDLELLNQIEDHETALLLLDEALATTLTERGLADLKEALRPLLLAGNLEAVDVDEIEFEQPRLPYEPETILIPAGPFLMGSLPGPDTPAEELPQHQVLLPAYEIGKYPVTNEQYAEFVKQNRQNNDYFPVKAGWTRTSRTPPEDKLDHPVVGISWFDARAYCDWLSQRSGRRYRLPSEAEWEKAASWAETAGAADGTGEKRIYPWGNDWDAGRCNTHNEATTPVTAYPNGASYYGCYDMAGNVQEWTSSLWGTNLQQTDFPYPYQVDDGREEMNGPYRPFRIHRGGSFIDAPANLRNTTRNKYDPEGESSRRGFRVVREL